MRSIEHCSCTIHDQRLISGATYRLWTVLVVCVYHVFHVYDTFFDGLTRAVVVVLARLQIVI
jgi:hypothetical protein